VYKWGVHSARFRKDSYSKARLSTLQLGGTVIAKTMNRTRRVDKGKSGQARKTAVSGGFGGGILSQLLKASV
jgi:hypothetical protein